MKIRIARLAVTRIADAAGDVKPPLEVFRDGQRPQLRGLARGAAWPPPPS